MPISFRREYLIRLPLPLAQLYSRARNAKDARARHDNCFYVFESLIKLAGAPLVAAYIQERRHGGERVEKLDRLLVQLAHPSLGQFVGILREASRHFGQPQQEGSHPLGHLWQQLNQKHSDLGGLSALFRRIKNGPEGRPAGGKSCSILQLLDALVTYRNAVIGHGAGRFQSFYEENMGPLMFPAVNDVLDEGVLDMLGPPGSRLVLLERPSGSDGAAEVDVRELVGLQSERSDPVRLSAEQQESFRPGQLAVVWPGHKTPLVLDPLLLYQDTEIAEDVLVLNRVRNRKDAEFLSYATGEATRSTEMASALNELLEFVSPPAASRSAEADSNPAPTVIPERKYDVLAELGRGGMGIVSLAHQLSLGRLVAIKTMPPELRQDEVALQCFRREMRALVHCEHPNIVKVIASGTLPDGEQYYTMEYVPGTDLESLRDELSSTCRDSSISALTSRDWANAVSAVSVKKHVRTARRISEGRSSDTDSTESATLTRLPDFHAPDDDPGGFARQVARLIHDAALALQTVHDVGLVHRDVTPCNLMLTPDGERVVLMDFGLANKQSLIRSACPTNRFLGSPRYAAPEQLRTAEHKVGPQADIRGLGVTMWELLTRRRLFEECEDEASLSQAVADRDVPLLRTIDRTFDPDLEAIVARATERAPENRIESAAELAMYLDMYLADKPLPIRAPGIDEVARRWLKKHWLLATTVASAAVVVTVTIVVAFALITHANSEERAARDAIVQQYREANIAIDQTLLRLAADLKNQPDAAESRTRMLEHAAAHYRQLAETSHDLPELKAAAGRAWLRLGDVSVLLEDWQQAETAYDSATMVFADLLKKDKTTLAFRRGFLEAQLGLATALVATSQKESAAATMGGVEQELSTLLTSHPNDADLTELSEKASHLKELVR